MFDKLTDKRSYKKDFCTTQKIFRGIEFHKNMKEEMALVLGERLNDAALDLDETQLVALVQMGPKFAANHNFLDGEGWRAGYTKPSLEERRLRNRKKNKAARKARVAQRKTR